MQFDEIAKLPPLAIIAFGVTLAVGLLVLRFGLFQGMKGAGGASVTSQASVAAVIVDPSALNHATAAVEGLTFAVTGATVALREHSKISERMAEEMDRAREELRIQREVNRR